MKKMLLCSTYIGLSICAVHNNKDRVTIVQNVDNQTIQERVGHKDCSLHKLNKQEPTQILEEWLHYGKVLEQHVLSMADRKKIKNKRDKLWCSYRESIKVKAARRAINAALKKTAGLFVAPPTPTRF